MPILTKAPLTPKTSPEDAPPVTRVVGIDLRSGPRYRTGLATMDGSLRVTRLAAVRTDEEILEAIETDRPALIAIDAPLGLPEGRCCAAATCECAAAGIQREVDRICRAAGFRPYPALLPSMVGLTLRGIALREHLQVEGHTVVECYPGMTQDVLGVPRKQAGLDGLRRGLKRLGIRGLPRARRISHDELDAVTCALTGVLHLRGESESMGPGHPVPLILPRRTAL